MTKQSITEVVDKLEKLIESSKPTIEQILYATKNLESLTIKLNQMGLQLQDSVFKNALSWKYRHIDFEVVCSVPSLLILLKTKHDWSAGALGFDEDSQPVLKQLVEQGLVKKSWIYFDQNGYEQVLESSPESYQENDVWFSPETGDDISKEEFDLEVQPRWFAHSEIRELAEEIYDGPRPVLPEPPAYQD